MRHIVVDTETTGLSPKTGHRMVEIAALELIDLRPTGKRYQTYLDPQRFVPRNAVDVHGLTTQFLRGKPLFKNIAPKFLDFIGDAPLVIHNAPFDARFLNAELLTSGHAELDSARLIDTKKIANRLFPKEKATLNDLCARFSVSVADRALHGALIDCVLLADVFRHLHNAEKGPQQATSSVPQAVVDAPRPAPQGQTIEGVVRAAPQKIGRPPVIGARLTLELTGGGDALLVAFGEPGKRLAAVQAGQKIRALVRENTYQGERQLRVNAFEVLTRQAELALA